MDKNKSYSKIYHFGEGKVMTQAGHIVISYKDTDEENVKIPFIDLSLMNEKREIGEDLSGLDIETTDHIKLLFSNIQGLEVLQRAIDYCREELKKLKIEESETN